MSEDQLLTEKWAGRLLLNCDTHARRKTVCGAIDMPLHWIHVIDLDFDLCATPIMFEINVYIQILSFPYGFLSFYNGIKYFVCFNF